MNTMRRYRPMILLGLIFLCLVALLFLGPTLFYRPWFIGHFFLREDLLSFLRRPQLLSRLHVLEPYGIRFHADDLDDVSIEESRREIERTRRNLTILRGYDRDRLGPENALSYDVLEWLLTSRLEGEAFLFHDYPVNQVGGVQSSLPSFMINQHPIDDERGAEEYNARLEKIGPVIDEVLRGLKYREQRGVLPPRFVFDRVIKEMRAFIARTPGAHPLYVHLEKKLEELKTPPPRREEILIRTESAIKTSLYPAYERLIAYQKTTRGKAGAGDGVWKLPDGEAYYRYMLKAHTTTDLSPRAVHEIGLREIETLRRELREILAARGLWRGTVGPSMRAAGARDEFLYPDDDGGREHILADYQAIVDEIDRGMGRLFDLRPRTGVIVKRVPLFKEEGAPGAYYSPPPLDGSRPGVFFANLRDVRSIPRFGMRTLAYHEAIPGHHFQITIAMHLKLPIFRRVPWFGAYTEGWALYAERLAAENGFMQDPMDRAGYLASELWRAVRLVVDTGLHDQRWSREKAISYMLENTGLSEIEATAEVERYIVWPGQACSYKIGQLKILELRERARLRLGENFDIKKFHNVLLSQGALPLDILERNVDEWIANSL